MNSKTLWAGIAVIVVIVIIVALLTYRAPQTSGGSTTVPVHTTSIAQTTVATTAPPQVSGTASVPVLMTDPPHTPASVTGEVVTYSNVMVHTTGATGGWVSATGSGTVNLASTINSNAQVIANAQLAANATVDQVQYTIDSAYVTANGTQKSVVVTNPTVMANVSGASSLGSNATIVIDTSPTVIVTYNQSGTVYVLQPSARAIVSTNADVSSTASVGSAVSLNADVNSELNASAPLLTISSASITTANSTATISVDVQNNGNSGVTINNVLLYGQQNANTTAGINLLVLRNVLLSLSANITASGMTALGTSSSGALSIESSSSAVTSSGIGIAPHGSAMLTFNGQLTYASGQVQSSLSKGAQYNIVVTGGGGGSASTTVTAS